MLRLRWAAVLIVPVLLVYAQRAPSPDALPAEVDRGAAGLTRWLHALKTRASLMMITAHPDDEDGGMLAYESRGAGARTALLKLNRGEGGQNAVSPDMYDALGLVRTQELLAYIYDAFALYRQLPAGVAGAYRILANLVSLGKNPEF